MGARTTTSLPEGGCAQIREPVGNEFKSDRCSSQDPSPKSQTAQSEIHHEYYVSRDPSHGEHASEIHRMIHDQRDPSHKPHRERDPPQILSSVGSIARGARAATTSAETVANVRCSRKRDPPQPQLSAGSIEQEPSERDPSRAPCPGGGIHRTVVQQRRSFSRWR